MSLFSAIKSGFVDSDNDPRAPWDRGSSGNTTVSNGTDYNYVSTYVTQESALSALKMTEADYREFKEYKAMNPLQRVLSDMNYSDEFLTILFATNTYRKENMKLDLMEFKTKEEHLDEADKIIKKLSFMSSKQLLIKAIYNLYYAYYVGANGTKVDQMVNASKHTHIEDTATKAEATPTAETVPVRGKNWKKNQKRRLKLKAKQKEYRNGPKRDEFRKKKAEWSYANYRKDIEASRAKANERMRKDIEELAPSYVAVLLQIPRKVLTPELIEAKRIQMLIQRKIKEIENEPHQ